MNRIDLHADGLMDRALRGELSADQRARLLGHCTFCAACRMELWWIEDQSAATAADRAADRARGMAAVEALFGRGAQDGEHERRASTASRSRRRTRRMGWLRTAAAAGAGLLIASGVAALYTEVRAAFRPHVAAETVAPTPRAAPPRKASRSGRRHSVQPTAPAPSADQVLAQLPVLPAPAPLPTSVPPTFVPRGTDAAPALRSTRTSSHELERAAERSFALANAERRAGRYEDAEVGYAELARDFAGTRSELAARISRANLLLQRLDQPARALEVYESYLRERPRGELAEEARVGVAACLERLGRAEEARAAWASLLEHHPDSPHAPRARMRSAAPSP